jgi:hypothetical protein
MTGAEAPCFVPGRTIVTLGNTILFILIYIKMHRDHSSITSRSREFGS